jgi:prepilin-type processing-associated H-X9-DG protein
MCREPDRRSGINHARTARTRTECVNNLRQLGICFLTYVDGANCLPTEAEGVSVFDQIAHTFCLPPDHSEPVKYYLCPERRRQPLNERVAFDDYGYGSGPGQAGISVLAAPKGLTLKDIEEADGTAVTLLLSHKGVNVDQYDGSGKNDTGWDTSDHARDPATMYRDCLSTERDLSGSIGSPHFGWCPSLFCDGHVQNIPYEFPMMPELWAYNDGTPVAIPE